ncbi:emp24/gp25L/p24 family/GOLD-domain-containing protein [Leucosporidium creatinivorum]|uniref:Emp24/gp25L/p24 family/GOLD-domain-containing protein n=1 Tax=Leucosporidium creatinivorum TaxID=106004 RepID=A0A1Y2G0I7_9BASI|nr:emp24/gp25L/p24 family/GOLD-domain-containing protein [Leucosporidium creatinivorum]
MRTSTFALPAALVALCLLVTPARAHTIDLAASSKECFFEDLHAEDKMTVTYQVAGGGHLDVDFWMKGPGERIMNEQKKKDTGTYSFTAEQDGRYTYCFSNEMSTVTGKTLSFNVHGVMYVEDDGHTAPIEREIRALSQALEAVKEEQEYIVVRERLHRDTAESTNSRIKYWSIIQTCMLFAVCGWQIFYLKRFFEVKRAV